MGGRGSSSGAKAATPPSWADTQMLDPRVAARVEEYRREYSTGDGTSTPKQRAYLTALMAQNEYLTQRSTLNVSPRADNVINVNNNNAFSHGADTERRDIALAIVKPDVTRMSKRQASKTIDILKPIVKARGGNPYLTQWPPPKTAAPAPRPTQRTTQPERRRSYQPRGGAWERDTSGMSTWRRKMSDGSTLYRDTWGGPITQIYDNS